MKSTLESVLAGRRAVAYGAGEYFGRYCSRSAAAFDYLVDDVLAGRERGGRPILPVSQLATDSDTAVVFLFCRDLGPALLRLAPMGFTWGKNLFDARWFGDGSHIDETYQVFSSLDALANTPGVHVHLASGAKWRSGIVILRTLSSGQPAGVFLAEDAELTAGDIVISSGTRLSVGRSGVLELRNGLSLCSELTLNCSLASHMSVGAGVVFSPCSVLCTASYTRIEIGAGTTFGSHLNMYAYAPISIGAGGMFSSHIFVVSGSGHDLVIDGHGRPPRPVLVGERVWVGWGAKLLAGTNLGTGSMVAASSVVNREFPSHTLVAGVPAKAVTQGISWDRDYRAYKQMYYPSEEKR